MSLAKRNKKEEFAKQRGTSSRPTRFSYTYSIASACLALALSAPTCANDRWGIQFAAGFADHHEVHVNKKDLGIVWGPGLAWWALGAWHFTMVVEGHLAAWRTEQGDINSNVVEGGVTPVFRFVRGEGRVRPFVEVGVGVRLISHPRISSNYTLSSAFHFADMAGVGAQFGERQQYQAGWCFQHLSNAGIKTPNPGINFSQIYAQVNF